MIYRDFARNMDAYLQAFTYEVLDRGLILHPVMGSLMLVYGHNPQADERKR